MIGGLGEDTYETDLGETGATAIDNGTETLNDLGGVGEVDAVFFEGVRISVTWYSTASSSDARVTTGRLRSMRAVPWYR